MVSMSDELKERNILKLILIVRFAFATLDVGRLIQFIFRILFSPFKLGCQPTEKKKSDSAISGLYGASFLEFGCIS
jgi:hypothetical protein